MRNKQVLTLGLSITMLSAAVTGCSTVSSASKDAKAAQPALTAQVEPTLAGKVVETMNGGGYTYLCLEKGGNKTWAAIPVTEIKVGQEVKLLNGAVMNNFQSKALNRTFDKIIFSGGLATDAAPAKAADAKVAAAANSEVQGLLEGKVVETMNAANYTYLQLEKDGKRSWAAIPEVQVAVGDEVELVPGVQMGSFTSSTLKRTFNGILFSGGLKSKTVHGAAPTAATAPAAAPAAAPALPAGHPKLDGAKPSSAAPAAKAAAAAPKTISGKVMETMNAGGYTYVLLDKGDTKIWAAFPAAEAKVGQQMTIAAGSTLPGFTSKTLNRKFDSIIFSDGPVAN